jgi:hypothetical protein
MSIPLNQFSLKYAFKNAVNLKYGMGSTIANTIKVAAVIVPKTYIAFS